MTEIAQHKSNRSEKTLLGVIIVFVIIAALFPDPTTKIILGLLLGLFFAHLCFAKIELALCLFIFFMPALDIFPPSLFGIKGMNAQTLIVLLLLLGSFTTDDNSIRGGSYYDPLRLPIIFFITMALISVINSSITVIGGSLIETIASVKQWLFYVLLYFVVLKKSNRDNHKKIFFVILITITVLVVYSLAIFIGGGAIFREHSRNRGMMLGNQPNLFGGFLAMYIPFFIAALYTKIKRRYLLGACTVINIIALLTTMSRGAWVAFFAAVCVLGMIKDRKILLLLVLAFVFYQVWLPETVLNRFDETVLSQGDHTRFYNQQYDSSTEVRRIQWKGALKMMAPNFIIGSGFGTYYNYVKTSGVLPMKKAAHSSVIKIAVEMGILGLFGYCWILLAAFKNAWYLFRRSKDPFYQAMAAGMLSCVVALFVCDLSGTRFYHYELTVYFWIIAGMISRAVIELKRSAVNPLKGVNRVQG